MDIIVFIVIFGFLIECNMIKTSGLQTGTVIALSLSKGLIWQM